MYNLEHLLAKCLCLSQRDRDRVKDTHLCSLETKRRDTRKYSIVPPNRLQIKHKGLTLT